MSPKRHLRVLEFCKHFSTLLCVLPTCAAYCIVPQSIMLILRAQKKKSKSVVLPRPRSQNIHNLYDIFLCHQCTLIAREIVKSNVSARYENNPFDNPRPVFCSLRRETTCSTHTQQVTPCCVSDHTASRMTPRRRLILNCRKDACFMSENCS